MSRESTYKFRQFLASPQGQSLQERFSAVSVSLLPFATGARINAEQLPTRISPKTLKGARSDLEEIARLLGTGDTENAARFALGEHSLYEVLLPAFAWLDRWTLRRPSLTNCTETVQLRTSLHIRLRCVFEHLLCRGTSLDDAEALRHQYVRFALAFVRSDALGCLARRLDTLRKRAAAASKDQISSEQISLLRISIISVEHDVRLARAVWSIGGNIDDEHVPALRQARDAAFAASNAIQHLCSFFMTLTEWLPGLEVDFGSFHSIHDAAVPQWDPQGPCRLVDLRSLLAGAANDLMAFLAHFARGAAGSRPWVEVAHGRMLYTAPADPHPQLLPVLLHPAVQYFLGWAAVGLPTEAGLKGSYWDGTYGDVRVPLLRGCRGPDTAAQGYQAKLKDMRELYQVLQAAAESWSAALRSRALQPPRSLCRTTNAVPPPPPSPLPAAQAHPVSADGASSSTSATATDGLMFTAPTTSAAAAAAAATTYTLPYRTAHMYRMLLGLFEEFWRILDNSDEPDIRFSALEARPSLEAGLLALAECLARLPPAAAARRLPAAWRTVVKQLACAPNPLRHIFNKSIYLVVGQLLATTAHLRAPTEQQPGEGRGGLPGQEGGGAGAGTAAVVGGGGWLGGGDGASGSGGSGGGGSGAEAGPSCVKQSVPPLPPSGCLAASCTAAIVDRLQFVPLLHNEPFVALAQPGIKTSWRCIFCPRTQPRAPANQSLPPRPFPTPTHTQAPVRAPPYPRPHPRPYLHHHRGPATPCHAPWLRACCPPWSASCATCSCLHGT